MTAVNSALSSHAPVRVQDCATLAAGAHEPVAGASTLAAESIDQPVDLVIREETLPHEQRTVITPEQVAALTQDGHRVALVKWADRVIPEQEYAKAVEAHGASDRFRIIGADDWKQQPAYEKSLILGTKELEDARAGTPEFPLSESYVHFDHSFKTQPNAGKRMARFAAGNGRLLDHEYWVDANGKRTHAFGHSAGYATAAISTLAMVQRMLGREVKLDQYAYSSPEAFFKVLVPLFKEATQNNHAPLKAVILGSPRGRSAQGAAEFIKNLNAHLDKPIVMDMWGRQETASRMPKGAASTSAMNRSNQPGLSGLEDYDMVFNCTYSDTAVPPFVTTQTLRQPQSNLKVIGDVTCDTAPDKNRIAVPNYETTDFPRPAFNASDKTTAVTIDHSPAFLPGVATRDMANQFFPHLKQTLQDRVAGKLGEDTPAARADDLFEHKQAVSKLGMRLGAELAEKNNKFDASTASDHDIKAHLAEHQQDISNFMKTYPHNPEDQSLVPYAMSLGLMGVVNPFGTLRSPKSVAYKASPNPDGVDARVNHVTSVVESFLQENGR